MSEDKDSPRGFRVTDRRRFSEEGEPKPGEETPDAPAPASFANPSASPSDNPSTSAPDEERFGALAGEGPMEAHLAEPEEPVSFSTFLLGLSTQALFHLGEIADPSTGETYPDLAGAKHVIDILGILKSKTMNNLEQAEERLLDAVLYDLRLKYVELVRGASKEEA
jgi:hypothetical protein